ncbi:hypothetical protein [Chitinophaga polysaccharea]|uniref:hypothetical protein n=1 Tax=Chitinophaga polysaccharea TaxID=1293035 RepID=UPI00115A7F5A|nr:hypothetical protein [Chitinophaga polysaccharea]
MKEKRLLRFFTKKIYQLSLILLLATVLGAGCKKSSQKNPCEDVLSEGMPAQAALILLDKQTGENILLSKNIDTSAITITPAPPSLRGGVIVKQTGSPMYGALVIPVTDTKEGVFKYRIDIANVGSITLSHTNRKEKSDNICNPYYISITEPAIEDHPFTVSRTGSRLMFEIKL